MISYQVVKCNSGVTHYKNNFQHRVNDKLSSFSLYISADYRLYISADYRLNRNYHRENNQLAYSYYRYYDGGFEKINISTS